MAYDPSAEEFEQGAQQERMQAFREKYKGEKNLKALAEAQLAVQRRKEALEADLKNANAEFDVLRFECIPDVMEEQGIERMTFAGIGRVQLSADIRVATRAANRGRLFGWFREHDLGDLIVETVNSSTLKAWVKGRMKEGKEVPPEDIMTVTPVTRASIVKG